MREHEVPITEEYIDLVEHPNAEEPGMDVFSELFKFSLQEMARVYMMHRKKKGDSWKDCTIEHLRLRLGIEIDEWIISVNDSSDEYNKIIDMLNVGFMLLERLADTHGLQTEED